MTPDGDLYAIVNKRSVGTRNRQDETSGTRTLDIQEARHWWRILNMMLNTITMDWHSTIY